MQAGGNESSLSVNHGLDNIPDNNIILSCCTLVSIG